MSFTQVQKMSEMKYSVYVDINLILSSCIWHRYAVLNTLPLVNFLHLFTSYDSFRPTVHAYVQY